jgi:hypothetical protein
MNNLNSIENIKNISPKILLKLIQRAKNYLKNDKVFNDLCKEYKVSSNFIDKVPIRFGDLEVSARTNKGVIILNYKLLLDGEFFKQYHYLVHELTHILQQWYGDGPTIGANDDNIDYLSNPDEQEGFQRQIEYIDDMFGQDEADNYVEHLLDHHDKDGKERKELKSDLMEKIDDE